MGNILIPLHTILAFSLGDNSMRMRYEPFGGIIFFENPPITIYVNKGMMKKLGYKSSELWESTQKYISAPLSVDFTITNECPLRCRYCYQSAGNKGDELV